MTRFKKFALFCLVYNLGVIVWGAYVRASGSGAGCGSHWPLCNGEVIPRPERIQTVIEFSHRVSSGLCLVFAAVLMGWAWRIYPRKHLARRAANWTFLFTLGEALIGAMLVLLSLVEKNQSAMRAFSISLHLVNTLFLLAALALAVRWSGALRKQEGPAWKVDRALRGWVLFAGLGMIALGVTGALAALGDTLFHSASLSAGWTQDFAAGSSFLLRLRILHPVLAVTMAVVLLLFSEISVRRADAADVRLWSWLLRAVVLTQVALGGINLLLLAPIPLQLTHLCVADLTWISFVMLACATLEAEAVTPPTNPSAVPVYSEPLAR